MSEQDFLYDDFFSPSDSPGIPTTIEVRGRSLTIGMRLLSFGDVRKLMGNNVKVVIDESGQPKMELKDGFMNDNELILAVLRSWPFKNRDGVMVPINEQSLSEIHPDVMGALLEKCTEFAQKSMEAQKQGIQGPFVKR